MARQCCGLCHTGRSREFRGWGWGDPEGFLSPVRRWSCYRRPGACNNLRPTSPALVRGGLNPPVPANNYFLPLIDPIAATPIQHIKPHYIPLCLSSLHLYPAPSPMGVYIYISTRSQMTSFTLECCVPTVEVPGVPSPSVESSTVSRTNTDTQYIHGLQCHGPVPISHQCRAATTR